MLLPSLTASLLFSALSASLLTLVQAQGTFNVEVVYFTENNVEIATESAPYNTCFASRAAENPYNYLTFAPYDATINFYTDANCQTFAFALDGHYSDHPGAKAGSFRWAGWSKDNLGLLIKAPFVVDPHALPPTPPPVSEPDNKQPPHPSQPANNNHGVDSDADPDDSGSTRASSLFFGAIAGIAMIVSIGGLVFWKSRGKKITVDKGKGVLPYSRVSNSRDGDGDADILLSNRGGHNSFELEGEDDDDEEGDLEKHMNHRGLHHMDSSGSGSGSGSGSSSNSGSSRNSGTYGRVHSKE
ncbi:hypothetical protein BGZ93_011110 [Podila epicladia]|nr:hypothetical protein BGZ92_001340 [Podila epicladia]KAG0087200.1 hypothetical protein BGZ93_011110 [Podila epicladia]